MNRKLYILTLVVFVLTGCSSIYTVKNFSSKHELYRGFNDFAGDRKINITFLNGSSITLIYTQSKKLKLRIVIFAHIIIN